jgi:hypothetical protein
MYLFIFKSLLLLIEDNVTKLILPQHLLVKHGFDNQISDFHKKLILHNL